MRKLMTGVVRLLSSYGLACVVLLLLALLTLLGTLEQGALGLLAAQKKYFDSFLVFDARVPVPWGSGDLYLGLPLPGGQLLLWVLCANLIVGGLVRIRKSRATVGVFIGHLGILLLLAAGFVKYYHAAEGRLTLWEGERGDEFESSHDWEIALTRDLGDGRYREYVIPQSDFADMVPGERRTFRRDELPFDLVLSDFMPNAWPERKGPMFEVPVPVADGFYLQLQRRQTEAELNVAGVYATLVAKSDESEQRGILLGRSIDPSTTRTNPFVATVDGVPWAIELRHVRYPLPYGILVTKFTAKFHPRTQLASTYESEVMMIEGDNVQPVVIRMNEPLRAGGHILFQSGFGPQPARPGARMYTTFSVVRNPSDQWPLIACIVIGIGLIVQFSSKLFRYIRAEARSQA
jgi:hypothetical protein